MNMVSNCFAYLDANTGTMLLQIVLGGLGGLLVVSRLFWHRIRGFFSFRSRNANAQESAEATDQLETPQQTLEQVHKRAA